VATAPDQLTAVMTWAKTTSLRKEGVMFISGGGSYGQ
jgi:hypothetical protein